MIRVELAKLFRRPRTYVIAGLLCALPFIVAVFLATTRIPPPPGQGGAFLSAVLSNGALYPAAAMALVMPVFLPVSVAVLAGDAVEVDMARLRELRRRRVLTLEELAEKAGVGRNTVWRLEHGVMGAQPRTIRKLAKALDVEPEDLVKTEG